LDTFFINCLNGLSWGMLLFLISAGLSTIFGVMGVLNFAHGSFYMLGAYFCMQIMFFSDNYWIGLILSPIAVAIFGALIERTILRHVYQRDITYQLLLTFALLLIVDDTVRLIWGAGYYLTEPPEILSGVINVFGQSYSLYRIFLIFMGPLVAIGLLIFFQKSTWGKIIRAASMDREMAEGLGINVSFIYTAVFALGCWLAGVGGALAAPFQSISPAMGEKIIIESFIVVVVGGLGSFQGAFLGALLLGVMEAFGTSMVGDIQMALPYLLLAIILIFRPTGFFGKTR